MQFSNKLFPRLRNSLPPLLRTAATAWTLSAVAQTSWSSSIPQTPGEQEPADPGALLRGRFETFRTAASDENLARYPEAARVEILHVLEQGEADLMRGEWMAALRPYVALAKALAHASVAFDIEVPGTSVESLKDLTPLARLLEERLEALGSPRRAAAKRAAAHQALLEQADNATRGYLVSALHQGRESGLRGGVYYLKQAWAHAQIVDDLHHMESEPATGTPLAVSGLNGYLESVEAELVALYAPPLADSRRRELLQLSALLKSAREMRDAGLDLGAFEAGLNVARGIATLTSEAAPAEEALRATLARLSAEITSQSGDVSLPRIWLSEARALLDDPGSERADVAALLERVLPDYAAVLSNGGASPVDRHADPAAGAREVTVTLVRWPFT